jgi:hypothetical protein
MDPEVKAKIINQLTAMAQAPVRALKKIQIDTIDLNPFLLRILGLNTPESIAEFCVSQRVERSVVTTYGTRVQRIAKEICGRGTGVEGADICVEEDGRRYYVQIKAGPNTTNKDIVNSINRLLHSAERRDENGVGLLGMTYGTRDRVSSITQRYSSIDWLIGREFWEFISNDPLCAKSIFELAGQVAERSANEGELYSDLYKKKVKELADEIGQRYARSDGTIDWEKLFDACM